MLSQCVILLGLTSLGATTACSEEPPIRIDVSVDKTEVPLGRSVKLEVQVSDAESAEPFASCLLLAYVNGRRWGAHETTDGRGRARIILPFPNVGPAEVRVRALPNFRDTCIVWAKDPKCKKAYLVRRFQEPAPVGSARLRASANHSGSIYLNGTLLAAAEGTASATEAPVEAALFRAGQNTLAVEADNETGIAGLMMQLEYTANGRQHLQVTDRDWEAWEAPPADWPVPVEKGEPVRVPGRLQDAVWGESHFETWPGSVRRDELFAGRPVPADAVLSAPVTINVLPRMIPSRRDPDHLIGMQWGSYFFKEMFNWSTAQAVPMVGFYESYNPNLIRQHAIWLMDMGVDFVFSDWPHHIPPDENGHQHWKDRSNMANGQIHATQATLEVYA